MGERSGGQKPLVFIHRGGQDRQKLPLGVNTGLLFLFSKRIRLALLHPVWYDGVVIFDHAPMNEQQRTQLQQMLEKQRDELRELLNRSANKDAHVRDDFHSRFPSYGDGEEENAEEVSDFEDAVSIERELETLLQKTDRAIDAIQNGSYGTCRVCKKEIEYERLSVVPTAETCIDHKSARA